jgi:hypothetical protein
MMSIGLTEPQPIRVAVLRAAKEIPPEGGTTNSGLRGEVASYLRGENIDE